MKAIVSKDKYEIVLTKAERKSLTKEEMTLSCIIRFLDTSPLIEKMILLKSRSVTMIKTMGLKLSEKGFHYSEDCAVYKNGEGSTVQLIIPPSMMQAFEKSNECCRINFQSNTKFILSKEEDFIGKKVEERYDQALPE